MSNVIISATGSRGIGGRWAVLPSRRLKPAGSSRAPSSGVTLSATPTSTTAGWEVGDVPPSRMRRLPGCERWEVSPVKVTIELDWAGANPTPIDALELGRAMRPELDGPLRPFQHLGALVRGRPDRERGRRPPYKVADPLDRGEGPLARRGGQALRRRNGSRREPHQCTRGSSGASNGSSSSLPKAGPLPHGFGPKSDPLVIPKRR